MIIKKFLVLCLFLLFKAQPIWTNSLIEQFQQNGYVEICDKNHGTNTFDKLYTCFDELIDFLQTNPIWARKLYSVKERFIRSKNKVYYSTDFFGYYDESKHRIRSQIAFYYSTHFHDFISLYLPEFNEVPQIKRFLDTCLQIQKPYINLLKETTAQLNLEEIFSYNQNQPPILFKVVKYMPSYAVTKPHYDGTAFSLFLDSTDNQSLLLSPYKSLFTANDFATPIRKYHRKKNQNSILLIPGTLLTEFSIYPTPHLVVKKGKTRYATIAFAMRPNYLSHKTVFSPLPNVKC